MAENEPKKLLPAYVSYKSFSRFLKSLQPGHLPSRIDKAVLTGMSGSVQSAMTNSLEFLGLMDAGGKPTVRLEALAGTSGADYADKLGETLRVAYKFLFEDGIDLARATTGQIQEAFRKQGVGGSTAVKSIAFFLSAAKDAAIPISKYVKTPAAPKPTTTRKAAPRATAEDDDAGDDDDTVVGPSLPNVDPALIGLLMRLPPAGEVMPAKDRERFLGAFAALMSVLYLDDE